MQNQVCNKINDTKINKINKDTSTKISDWNQPSITSLSDHDMIYTCNAGHEVVNAPDIGCLRQISRDTIVQGNNEETGLDVSSQLREMHAAIRHLTMVQAKLADAQLSYSQVNFGTENLNASSRTSSKNSSESFEIAINFVRIDSNDSSEITHPRDIPDLSAIDHGSLTEYYVNPSSQLNWELRRNNDYDLFTSKLKIIGAPTDDPKCFTDLLIEKNMWLTLKYSYIDRVYKTETSFKNSYNYIITVDNAAFRKIIDFGQLNFGRCRCKIYHYIDIESCNKCHSFSHEGSECGSNIICKLELKLN